MKVLQGDWNAQGLRIGVIVSRWNELVTRLLLDGALDQLRLCGGPEVTVVEVPGTWEVPPAAATLAESKSVDGIVALGCILQGATPHAQMLATDVSSALMELQTRTGVPIAWGVLTPETQEQALERAGMKLGNKGREAALACVEMVKVLRKL
ncbi:MAG: 6,7-dimethyl-8-ribityllumazine synthase [Armatimonadetes bacterium]|nr:6,7-dimethyl-8-ribityllumazine synthase [Armatimonadota bacterium]